MSNTEWKKGYEEGFAAGWKAAKNEQMKQPISYRYGNPIYYPVHDEPLYDSMNDTLSSYTTDTIKTVTISSK